MKKLLTITIFSMWGIWCHAQTGWETESRPKLTKADSDTMLMSHQAKLMPIPSANYSILPLQVYRINWNKVKTFTDFKLIMQSFPYYIVPDPKHFKRIKKYLIKKQ